MTAVSSRASHGRATALDPAGSATELDDAFLEQVRERLLAEGGAITDTRIATAVRETGRVLGAVGAVKAAQHVKAQLTGLGPLEPLLPASGLSDLYVNGHENVFRRLWAGFSGWPPHSLARRSCGRSPCGW